jgi:hypothetical protein
MAKPMLCVEPVTNATLSLSNIFAPKYFFLLAQSIAPSNSQERVSGILPRASKWY